MINEDTKDNERQIDIYRYGRHGAERRLYTRAAGTGTDIYSDEGATGVGSMRERSERV